VRWFVASIDQQLDDWNRSILLLAPADRQRGILGRIVAEVESAGFGPQAEEFVQDRQRRSRKRIFVDPNVKSAGNEIRDVFFVSHLSQVTFADVSCDLLMSILVCVHGEGELQSVRVQQQAGCKEKKKASGSIKKKATGSRLKGDLCEWRAVIHERRLK
jgi:hypothetical protein